MKTKFKQLLKVSRPISWVNTAFPFGAGYLASGGALDLTFWVGSLYFLIPYNLLMYGVNDVFDYESDIRNPRKGGVEGATTPRSLHRQIIVAAIVFNLPFILYLLLFGSIISGIALVLLLFFVVAYSAEGLRFKEKPVLDSLTSSLHFVGPLVFALCLTGLNASQLPLIIAFGLWGVASHAFGAIQDILPDREANIGSIATKFGARKTVWIAIVAYIVAGFTVILAYPSASIIGLAGLAYAVNLLPYIKVTDEKSADLHSAWRRFMWLNMLVGFLITMFLILQALSN